MKANPHPSVLMFGCLLIFGAMTFASPAFSAGPVGLEGEWRAEQTGPNSAAPSQAILNFARAENGSFRGTMREGSGDLPLFDVREMGTNVSFTLVVAGTPYVSILY